MVRLRLSAPFGAGLHAADVPSHSVGFTARGAFPSPYFGRRTLAFVNGAKAYACRAISIPIRPHTSGGGGHRYLVGSRGLVDRRAVLREGFRQRAFPVLHRQSVLVGGGAASEALHSFRYEIAKEPLPKHCAWEALLLPYFGENVKGSVCCGGFCSCPCKGFWKCPACRGSRAAPFKRDAKKNPRTCGDFSWESFSIIAVS